MAILFFGAVLIGLFCAFEFWTHRQDQRFYCSYHPPHLRKYSKRRPWWQWWGR